LNVQCPTAQLPCATYELELFVLIELFGEHYGSFRDEFRLSVLAADIRAVIVKVSARPPRSSASQPRPPERRF